jgi:putative flavoprotein involved in K+ transport
MPFPPTWPTYIPKDKLANWFEHYVDALELNFWTGTAFEGGSYDEDEGRWTVRLRRSDGDLHHMRPRHVVMATGVSGIPNRPTIPTLDRFQGPVLHSSEYRDGEDWSGQRALVIGTGNSGHDIAQDLHSSGAKVTMVQRSPSLVVQIEPSAQLPYALYDSGPPLEECDLITVSTPFAMVRRNHQRFTAAAREMDKDLLHALTARGFRLDFGQDEAGWQFNYLTRGGGYYFNVGCSDLIAEGAISLIQLGDIAEFTADRVRLGSGETRQADMIVTATGYQGQEALVRQLFGDAMADKVGQIWGFDDADSETAELRNMFCTTAQPGLWFMAGSLAQCRIYSKYLALQIKARDEGLAP